MSTNACHLCGKVGTEDDGIRFFREDMKWRCGFCQLCKEQVEQEDKDRQQRLIEYLEYKRKFRL